MPVVVSELELIPTEPAPTAADESEAAAPGGGAEQRLTPRDLGGVNEHLARRALRLAAH